MYISAILDNNMSKRGVCKMEENVKTLYVINNSDEHNPGGHHEMHTITHAKQLNINSYKELRYFNNELEALIKAKSIYSDANGCANCCPKADIDRRHRSWHR